MGVKKILRSHKRDDCIGCGSCAQIERKLFSMDHRDGKATLAKAEKKGEYDVLKIDEIQKIKADECVRSCPVGIIRLGE